MRKCCDRTIAWNIKTKNYDKTTKFRAYGRTVTQKYLSTVGFNSFLCYFCKLGKHIIGPHKKISSRTISTLIVIKRIEVEARANQSVPFSYWRLYCVVARTVLSTLFGTNHGRRNFKDTNPFMSFSLVILFGVVMEFGMFCIWSEREFKILAEYGLHSTIHPPPRHTLSLSV